MRRERARVERAEGELEQAVAYGHLLAAMHQEVLGVTAERDALIVRLLSSADAPSNRALAKLLSISKGRADTLARIARAGGRRRRA
jgi:hypothetical protein